MTRRQLIATSAAAAETALRSTLLSAEVPPVFARRGYYICFMRLPTFGLRVWQEILDGAAADGANTIILWMGGAFRSRRFPVTWQWAKEHENVKADFTRELIAHAHRRGIEVLLGFTPFGYDGVNQLPLEKPELKATGEDGKPVREFGIGCWGWNLCPAQEESQRFMREYVREMAFEFYPAADGLFIESSDYAICHCAQCGPKFFDREFAFVRDISREVWARKPEATVVVYPHYFSGAKLRFSFNDLLDLFRILTTNRTWSAPGALTAPGLVRHRAEHGRLDGNERAVLREQLSQVRAIAERYRTAGGGAKELHRISQWLADQWTPENEAILEGR